MKTKTMIMTSIIAACLFSPLLAQASSYEKAVSDATASIDKAKAVNYEWRDSRKLLKKADKLNQAGNTEQAIKLLKKAEAQGELAVAQAKQQAAVSGPH